jgi:hypothetical protein
MAALLRRNNMRFLFLLFPSVHPQNNKEPLNKPAPFQSRVCRVYFFPIEALMVTSWALDAVSVAGVGVA